MRHPRLQALLGSLMLYSTLSAQLQIKKVSEPSGKTLDNALKASALVQPDTKPFAITLKITQAKSETSDYDATVEETWISPTQWVRTVKAKDLSQTIVTNSTGTHVVTTVDYFPGWLRSFITALVNPVPDADTWDKLRIPLTHIELPNGGGSNPCMRQEFNLGAAPVLQINFRNVCFKEGLLEMVQSEDYSMGFSNYQKFGKLKVPRTLSESRGRISLIGSVVRLELAESADPALFASPPEAVDKDPLATYTVGTEQLTKLAGGTITLPWPNPIPGHGMFTVWVSIDRHGVVREVHTLNTDESGFAYDMAQKLLGLHWKAPILNGTAVQVQGPLVFSYPPDVKSTGTKPPSDE